jgi:hypothetical protein
MPHMAESSNHMVAIAKKLPLRRCAAVSTLKHLFFPTGNIEMLLAGRDTGAPPAQPVGRSVRGTELAQLGV